MIPTVKRLRQARAQRQWENNRPRQPRNQDRMERLQNFSQQRELDRQQLQRGMNELQQVAFEWFARRAKITVQRIRRK